jgi:apolipoprotein N-acyltransferase
MSATRGYAYVIAPDGQTLAHAPQPMHKCGSTLIRLCSGSLVIARVEHTSMHWVQPVIVERLWAQDFSL